MPPVPGCSGSGAGFGGRLGGLLGLGWMGSGKGGQTLFTPHKFGSPGFGQPRPSGSVSSTGSFTSMSKRLKRSEEHTSELQSPCNLVCRLLLEKKNRHSHEIASSI